MKLIFKEQPIDYSTYSFPYCVYCIKEDIDSLSQIYSKGFLPYSNDLNETNSIFYLARSVKVNLAMHTTDRREKKVHNNIYRFIDSTKTSTEFIDIQTIRENIDFYTETYLDFAKKNFKGGMAENRIRYILNREYLNGVFRITYESEILADILIICENYDFIHSWFSFYNTNYPKESEIGKWVIYKLIEWSKENEYKQLFLGTCYGKNSIYKLQFSKESQYFDGQGWANTISELKKKIEME